MLAGPYATYQLALRADVLKIEDPDGGDWTREGKAPDGLENQNMGTAYLTQNANKKSITLNLKSRRDIEKLKKLVEDADVFVENFGQALPLVWGCHTIILKRYDPISYTVLFQDLGKMVLLATARPMIILSRECGIMRLTDK